MSPFLPPDQQYEFVALGSPATVHVDEVDDNTPSLSPSDSPAQHLQHLFPSQAIQEETVFCEHKELPGGEDKGSFRRNRIAHIPFSSCPAHKKVYMPRRQALKKLATSQRHQKACDRAKSEHGQADEKGTVVLAKAADRFSACIPCRRRKIKCIPLGTSHQYRPDGTNTGICATCVRRKKECFWPKLVALSPLSHTLLIKGRADASATDDSSKGCPLREASSSQRDMFLDDASISWADLRPIKKEEEEKGDEAQHECTKIAESPFRFCTQAFGRSASTPGLLSPSSSSSTCSDSSPVSPSTEVDFCLSSPAQSLLFDERFVPVSDHRSAFLAAPFFESNLSGSKLLNE